MKNAAMTHYLTAMIIVSRFKLNNNILSGFITVIATITESAQCCPLCGGRLTYRDSRPRKLKNLFGEVSNFLLRRLRCEECGKLHTEIPDIIQPYKHYDSETIQSVIDGTDSAQGCAADDSTIRRWKTSFAEAETDIQQRLLSVYARTTDGHAPLLAASQTLPGIKAENERWLVFVMRLLINNGYKLCTRFAFCPCPRPAKVGTVDKTAVIGGKDYDKTIIDSG
jgi:hypothetical protein